MTTTYPNLYESLFDVADLSPDTGEGGEWHRRSDYAHTIRWDHADCVKRDDTEGAHDCNADAIDALIAWTS